MSGFIMDTTEQVLRGVGRIYTGDRKPFVEGTPAQIKEDYRNQARDLMIEAARAKDWIEIDPETLERVRGDRLISDEYNVVLQRMRVAVWVGGDPRSPLNEPLVWGWYVGSDGYPVFLQLVDHGPTSPATVRAQESTIRSRLKMAELDARAALLTTPLEPVTLAELQGVQTLPTLKAAYDVVVESGKCEIVGERLRVHLRVRTDRELTATRVLYASEPLVVDAIKSADKGKGAEIVLPDVQVLAGGGIA